MGLLTRDRVRRHTEALLAAALLVGGLVPEVSAQAAIATAGVTTVHKDPRPDSPPVAEVPAGTELKLEWDKVRKVDLLAHSQVRTELVFLTSVELHNEVWVLLPSRESSGEMWVRVAANKKKGWVPEDAVRLVPGSEFAFSAPVPVMIPVRESQVPRLREGKLPVKIHDYVNIVGGRANAYLRLWVAVAPEGEVKAVGLVQSSRILKLDSIVAEMVRRFRFEPVRVDGGPAFALLSLELAFSGR